MVPVALSISAIVLVEVPVAFVASRHLGLDGVWVAYPACFIAMLLFQSTYYRLFWRKQKIQKLI
jgi:Na+-driven multidrug efflux pump